MTLQITHAETHLSAPRQLFLQFTESFCYSGGLVRGTAYLNSQNPLSYHRLVLGLRGCEQSNWKQKLGTQQVVRKGNNLIYEDSFTLSSKGEVNGNSSHRFPFSFRLPRQLPGSFMMRDGNSFIKYQIQLKLLDSQEQDICEPCRKGIDICEQKKEKREVRVSERFEVVDLYCFSKGCGELKLELSSGTLESRQNLRIKVGVNNTLASKNIRTVEIQFVKVVSLMDDNKNCKALESVMRAVKTHPILAEQEREEVVDLHLPEIFQPTAIGTLVFNQYHLKISIHFDSVITSSHQLKHPLWIISKPPSPIFPQNPNPPNPQSTVTNPLVMYDMKQQPNTKIKALSSNGVYPRLQS